MVLASEFNLKTIKTIPSKNNRNNIIFHGLAMVASLEAAKIYILLYILKGIGWP